MNSRHLAAVLLAATLVTGAHTQAAPGQEGAPTRAGKPGAVGERSGDGASRVPPPSAIEACAGKPDGTACEVTTPAGTRSGACAFTPDRKYFACRPDDPGAPTPGPQGGSGDAGAMKGGPSRVPPQSAIDACTGKPDGTACEVTTPGGTRSGSCAFTPDGTYFACKPDDRGAPPRPQEGQGTR